MPIVWENFILAENLFRTLSTGNYLFLIKGS